MMRQSALLPDAEKPIVSYHIVIPHTSVHNQVT